MIFGARDNKNVQDGYVSNMQFQKQITSTFWLLTYELRIIVTLQQFIYRVVMKNL